MTTDQDLRARINALVAEQHELRTKRSEGTIDADEERSRLQAIEVELDQCWDLLRQREALRDAGDDPDQAKVRSAEQVEGYLS
jgi:hypothetical protein